MLRRLSGLCIALLLVVASVPTLPTVTTYAQDGSPVAVDPVSSDPGESDEPTVDSESEPVMAADDEGNTPAGINSTTPVYALFPSVYLNFYRVTISGNSTAEEVAASNLGPFVPGYRMDNARAFEISTTAMYEANITVCIYYGPGQFENPGTVVLYRFDEGVWELLAGWRDAYTICGYTSVLGTFVVAEPGTTPEPSATAPSPTETPTATATETLPPTATRTHTPTDTATATSTETVAPSNTPIPSETPTSTATATSTSVPTESPTATETSTAIPTETSTATVTSTAVPTETSTATATPTSTATHTSTPEPTETATSSATASTTPTATPSSSATAPPTHTTSPASTTQFALDNVWVTYGQPAPSGSTRGSILDGSALPSLPSQYQVANAFFFGIEGDEQQSGGKQVCVLFDATRFANPSSAMLLRNTGSGWVLLSGQILTDLDDTQGTRCGYTTVFGAFALAETLPPTSVPTRTPSRTATATSTPSNTPTTRPTWTPTATATPINSSTPTSSPTSTETWTPSATPSATATVTSSSTPTLSPTSTPSPTATPTLAPGSYPTGSTLRATTRVNLRTGPTTASASIGVVASGAIVQVTGPSTAAGGHTWVPVTVPALGSGWIASEYLKPVPGTTPTRTPAAPTATRTPGDPAATRTATRPAGGFIAGDSVRTTTRLNLRSAPGTSSQVLVVLPANAFGHVTGAGVSSGGTIFYPVLFDGQPGGYVAGKYLRQAAAAPTPTRTVIPTATIAGIPTRWTTNSLNMRSGAGTGYRIIAKLPKGARVTVTGNPKRSGGYDWYPVTIDGIGSGWVVGKYLTAIPPCCNAP